MRPSVLIITFVVGAMAIAFLNGLLGLVALLGCLLAFLITAAALTNLAHRPSPPPEIQERKSN